MRTSISKIRVVACREPAGPAPVAARFWWWLAANRPHKPHKCGRVQRRRRRADGRAGGRDGGGARTGACVRVRAYAVPAPAPAPAPDAAVQTIVPAPTLGSNRQEIAREVEPEMKFQSQGILRGRCFERAGVRASAPIGASVSACAGAAPAPAPAPAPEPAPTPVPAPTASSNKREIAEKVKP